MTVVHEQPVDEKKYSVRVYSKFGDDFHVALPSLRLGDAKQRIKQHLGGDTLRNISYGTYDYMEDDAELQVGVPVEVDYMLEGGAVGLSYTLKLPEALNIKILCFKCGLQDCPDPKSQWLCEDMCCCLFSNCGFNECAQTQILCIGPCSKPAINITTSVPAALVINILCYKCGVHNFPDFRSEDFIKHTCLCLHYEFGFKDMCSIFQLFCLICTM